MDTYTQIDKYVDTGAIKKESETKTGDFVSCNEGDKETTLIVYTKLSCKTKCKCGKYCRVRFELDQSGALHLDDKACEDCTRKARRRLIVCDSRMD
jgi:hypothetical protein